MATDSESIFRVGLIQHACGADASANLGRACEMIRDAAVQGAHLVVTQELFTGQYFPQTENAALFELAEPIPGPTTRRMSELAVELGIEISASIFERRAAGVYHNTTALIGRNGNLVARYRKMHIPDDPRFYEKFYFTPGDAGEPGWQAPETAHGRVGLLVCWDQWFPEAARLTALRGAQVLLYPTAIGYADEESPDERARQREAWQTVQRAHAITNGVFVAAVNRVGVEGELTFWGSSFVVDPGGRIIAEAPADGDHVAVVDCDLRLIDEARQGWPFLRDRRTDAYGGLTSRYLDDSG